MNQYIEFVQNHPILVSLFVVVLLMFIWSLFSSALYGKFMLPPDRVVYHINHDKAKVFDLRDKSEYDSGHIGGATHLGPDTADIEGKIKADHEQLVILYGDVALAMRCLRTLHLAGYKRVFCVKGGIHAWREAGLPLLKNA